MRLGVAVSTSTYFECFCSYSTSTYPLIYPCTCHWLSTVANMSQPQMEHADSIDSQDPNSEPKSKQKSRRPPSAPPLVSMHPKRPEDMADSWLNHRHCVSTAAIKGLAVSITLSYSILSYPILHNIDTFGQLTLRATPDLSSRPRLCSLSFSQSASYSHPSEACCYGQALRSVNQIKSMREITWATEEMESMSG